MKFFTLPHAIEVRSVGRAKLARPGCAPLLAQLIYALLKQRINLHNYNFILSANYIGIP